MASSLFNIYDGSASLLNRFGNSSSNATEEYYSVVFDKQRKSIWVQNTEYGRYSHWNDIDGKPSTFPTSTHYHDDRYLQLSGGTMNLGEGLKFHADENYFGTNLDARIISLLDGNGTTVDGGLIIDERGTYNGTETITELLRIRDSEFKWKGNTILHAGNYNSYALKLDGSNVTAGSTFNISITGSSSSAGTASNLAAGSAGSIPYQSSTGTTTFLAIGSTDQILTVENGVPKWKNGADSSAYDSRYLKLSGGTMTGSPYINMPASAATISDSQPFGITYGRIQGYGNLNIAADTDGSQSEYVIITSGYGISNATGTNGLAIGYDTLTWKGNGIIHAGNISSQHVEYAVSAGSAGSADNANKLNGYSLTEIYWADVHISGTSSTTTTPTVKSVSISSTGSDNGIHFSGGPWINNISGDIIFRGANLRFGTSSWDYNEWAGLNYDHSNKRINIGLADGRVFTTNSAQNGGTIRTVNSKIEIFPGSNGDYGEGIRIHSASNGWTTLMFCSSDNTNFNGTSAKSWSIHTYDGNFYINKNASSTGTASRLWGHGNGWTIGNTSTSTYALNVNGAVWSTSGFIKNGYDDNYALTAGGGHKQMTSSVLANTLTLRDGSGYIFANYFNSNITDDDTITIGSVYVRNSTDNYIRRVSLAAFLDKTREKDTVEITRSLTVTEDWMDTGIRSGSSTDPTATYPTLKSGTWAVQVRVPTSNGTDGWDGIYSGIFSIYHGTNSTTDNDEIVLHFNGHAWQKRIYLRTQCTESGNSWTSLQIAASSNYANAYNIRFKFKKLLDF